MVSRWCVKITCLPQNCTNDELGNKFSIDRDIIDVPRNQQGPNYYAWVNGFSSEQQANEFVKKWNNQRIRSGTIKCKTASTKSHIILTRPPSVPRAIDSRSRQDSDQKQLRNNVRAQSLGPERILGSMTSNKNTKYDDGNDENSNQPSGNSHSINMHECNAGDQCREWNCEALQPENRPKPCSFKQYCYNMSCLHLHPPDRELCSKGVECIELTCRLNHPAGRTTPCETGSTCTNYYCMNLHPADWDPCPAGDSCTNSHCSHTCHSQTRRKLKSIERRHIDRQQASLPILESKEEFCRRLKEERVLIVRAETGSGKSTQLPQYAAEYFGGLVVCTQPRVVAAISLARRVASEYDGTSVGESVGYQVGSGGAGRDSNLVPGKEIIFMTDSALIQESQRDQQLSKIKVLIIDEAHERSLNTDIVIGLGKLLLDCRPTDFYVVITSATIDPSHFLNFFEKTNVTALNVPGRVFDVTLEYIPKADDSPDDYGVSVLRQLYHVQPQGHILVFLPGQREIEKALALFSRDIPDNCVALPLYGSLSPEEQDQVLQFDEGATGERRMVVFCTNVAETSLTIKNTRLVIDSGWAKEARYDPTRRLTVIEMVRISKSSADQRKGRAGRTAPGHCVRLYKEDELIRPNIEPEIRRSSLDLVVLQLLRLGLNPVRFPFIDAPDKAVFQKSLQLLQSLGCIAEKNIITLRGELFAELGLDPRLSVFMVDTYTEHSSILELTANIVAILTAPGSLFFMGGRTKEEKQAARGRIAVGAQEHSSDLLYLVSVYKKWQSIGTIDTITRTCRTCQTPTKRDNSCRSCRVQYTVQHSLNNKILNIIEIASSSAMKIITKTRWQIHPRLLTQPNESEIIGTHLLKNFPEQYGYLLVPHLPNEGVRMVANRFRARITHTSVFVQRRVRNTHFIAMSITKLSTGDYVIERLHPISVPESTSSKALKIICTVSNVGWEWNYEIRKQSNTLQEEPSNKWLVYEYDCRPCKLILWGRERTKKALCQAFPPIVRKALDSLLQSTRSIDCGPIRATFESGLICIRTENLHHDDNSAKNRIDLQHIRCKNFEELDKWLDSTLEAHLKDLRENSFQPRKETKTLEDDYEAPPFFIVFKSEESFKKALARMPPYHLCSQRSDSTNIVHMNVKDSWGRQLLLKMGSGRFYSENDIQVAFDRTIVSCKQMGRKLLPGIQLNNMPAGISEAYIRNALGGDFSWTNINILRSDRSNPRLGSTSARVYFDNEQQCDEARRRLRSNGFHRSHAITIMNRYGTYKEIVVEPSIEKLKLEPQIFLCTAKSRRAALEIHSKLPSSMIDSSSYVTVTHMELYPKFKNVLKRICDDFHVQVEEVSLPAKNGYSAAVRCIFTGANPPKTAMAASTLSQATSPIIIKLNDERQKYLFDELFREGLMKMWTEKLKLSCEKKDKYGTLIEIYGPQIRQGQLMRYIADYSIQFDNRYRVLDISAEAIGYFGHQKAADVKLQEINSKWAAEGCSVAFMRRTSNILLYIQPRASSETANTLENEIKQLLNTLAITSTEDEISIGEQEFSRQCAFCRQIMAATRTFRICGHAYCRCALNMLKQLPFQCLTCHSRIHIQDIQEIFSNNRLELIRLCKSSIQTYLLSSTDPKDKDQLFCPNDECDGLIISSQGYQTCFTCGRNVCGMCRLIDDDLHEDRTCAERDEAQRKHGEFLPQLFQAAEKFIQTNWSLELPSIISFDSNKYLEQTACKSLKRFNQGVASIGHKVPLDIARGFFAFHGTSVEAIKPICESGFDPSRRRGQAYGPGEYFGITAAVSHGYSGKDDSPSGNQMMIIAFILQCDHITTQKGFCYVVNNPKDWSVAFNLPVAVVTYGNNSSRIYPLLSASEWKSPFRWHWQQDNRQFEPYNDKINAELEQLYEKWKLKNGPSKTITTPLIRYVDDVPQTYAIDFENNIQTNTKTNYRRQIERRPMSPSKITDTKTWYFRNEHHTWAPYESLIQKEIEGAYQAYRLGLGPSTLIIHFPGRPESYEIDFLAGRQMNKTTSEIRLIKRQ